MPGRHLRSARRSHPSGALLAVVLLVLAAAALERAGWLPERMADAVRSVEGWLDPLLREVGLDLSPRSGEPHAEPDQGRDRAAVAQALSRLAEIPIEAERARGYDREAWRHWLDADGDCQDTRQEVLLAERIGPTRPSATGCRIMDGSWRDAYTGEVVQDPGVLDVDHMVPLAEAHRSGGHAWPAERRAAYANDLGDTRTLIAVTASANRSKGDQGPEEWLPPLAAYRCRYAADWVAVKVRWSLSMDERERVTLGNLLRSCIGG